MTLAWKMIKAGWYTSGAEQPTYTIRREPNAGVDNRWSVRYPGNTPNTSHRLLVSAKRAAEKHAAQQPQDGTTGPAGSGIVDAVDQPSFDTLTKHGKPETGLWYGRGTRPLDTGIPARVSTSGFNGVAVRHAHTGALIDSFGRSAKFWFRAETAHPVAVARRHDDTDSVPPAREVRTVPRQEGKTAALNAAAADNRPLDIGDVVTITASGVGRHFTIDELPPRRSREYRVSPRNPLRDSDGTRAVARGLLRRVPRDQVEPLRGVRVDDIVTLDTGRNARQFDVITLDHEQHRVEVMPRNPHDTTDGPRWVSLRDIARVPTERAEERARDDQAPVGSPTSVGKFTRNDLVSLGGEHGPAYMILWFEVRGGVTGDWYAVLSRPDEPEVIRTGAYVKALQPLSSERVRAVWAGHDISVSKSGKLDANSLVVAVCSCREYVSHPGRTASVLNAGANHAAAHIKNAACGGVIIQRWPDTHRSHLTEYTAGGNPVVMHAEKDCTHPPTLHDMILQGMPAEYMRVLTAALTPHGFHEPIPGERDDANERAFLIHPTSLAVGVYRKHVRLSFRAPYGGAPDEDMGTAFFDLDYGTQFEVIVDIATSLTKQFAARQPAASPPTLVDGDQWYDNELGVAWWARADANGDIELYEPDGPGRIPARRVHKIIHRLWLVHRAHRPDTANSPKEPDAPCACPSPAPSYYCPTSGEVESPCHGGFDTCCDRPDLHRPATETKTAEDDHSCGPACPSPCPQDDDDPRGWQG